MATEDMAAWPVVGLSYSLVRSFSLYRHSAGVYGRSPTGASEPAHNVNPIISYCLVKGRILGVPKEPCWSAATAPVAMRSVSHGIGC